MRPWLIVLDPFEKLEPILDTSLFIGEQALAQNVPVFFATEHDLSIEKDKVYVRPLKALQFHDGKLPSVEIAPKQALKNFGVIWVRKDPPVNSAYIKLCWLLGTVEKTVKVLNSPSLLVRYHEKMLPLEGVAQGFLKPVDITPTYLGNASEEAIEVLPKTDSYICKPFLGHAGRGVEKKTTAELQNSKAITDTLIQPFLPEVQTMGDFRVLYTLGKMDAWFARVPKPGQYISNIAQGGTAKVVPLSAGQKKVLERTGKFLKKLGVTLAGIDLIGTKISEINITSPTGTRLYQQLTGKNIIEEMVKKILKSL